MSLITTITDVSGVVRKVPINNMKNDLLANDNFLNNEIASSNTRINNIDELGINANIALYDMKDEVNINNYVSNEYNLTVFEGYTVALRVTNANTGNSTLDVGDGAGAIPIQVEDEIGNQRDTYSNEIYSWNILQYNGTSWILLDKSTNISAKIGDKANLTTNDKITIVSAINELNSIKAEKTEIYTRTEIDNKDIELAGIGRTIETIKGNVDNISTHKLDISNPHSTTANQVGAYSKIEMQTDGQSSIHFGNLTNVPNLADSSWKEAVASYDDLPITGNNINDMRIVADDGDGKTSMYRCYSNIDSDPIASQWEKIADLDWTNDHGALVGLGDDDHIQYLRHDGIRAMSDNLNMGGNQLLNSVLQNSTTLPLDIEGLIYYDSNTKEAKLKTASGISIISGAGALIRAVEITSTLNQTIFDVGQNNIYSYSINSGVMNVYKKNTNGFYELLDINDYVETDDKTITLNTGASLGDEYYFKWMKNIASMAGAIESNSITNDKLVSDIKIGSLASVNTNDKISVINAINETLSKIRTDENIQDVVGGFLNAGNDITLTYDDTGNQLTVSFTGNYQPAGIYNTVIGTDTDVNISGATIIDNLTMTDGVITSHGTRNLTYNDVGALADHETAVNSDKVDGYHVTKNGAGGSGIINFITT